MSTKCKYNPLKKLPDECYWVAGYSNISGTDPVQIVQPLCWQVEGGGQQKCTRSCAYCPHTFEGGKFHNWSISEIDQLTGKATKCGDGFGRSVDPKFCMPTCDKNNHSGHCINKVCVCPSQYSDCKHPGVLTPANQLCSLETGCCGAPTNTCSTCLVRGKADNDYVECNSSGIPGKHGCVLPSSTTPIKSRSRPNCGNYTNLALTWT